MPGQAVLYTDAFSSFAFPTRRVSVSRPQQRFGQDALRGHGPALDIEDAQSRLLWNSVSRRVARGGCLREHARCANAGPGRSAAAGHAGQRLAIANQTQPVTLVVKNAPAATTRERPTPSKSRPMSASPPRCRPRMASRKEQRADQRDARCADGGERLLLARARANRPAHRHVQRSVQVHDRRGDHPCGPGAHRSAHQRGNDSTAGAAGQQREPIGTDRRDHLQVRDRQGLVASVRSSSSARIRKASTRPVSFRRATCRRASFCSGERRRATPPTASRARRARSRGSRRGRSHRRRPSPSS